MNALTAPSEVIAGLVPKWQARDDVYQVGQLLAMLVKGDARARIRPADVRAAGLRRQLKEIIYRCIGERRKRYESADELITALRTRPATLATGRRALAEGRAPGLHRHPVAAARRGGQGGDAGRRDRARRAVGAHHRAWCAARPIRCRRPARPAASS